MQHISLQFTSIKFWQSRDLKRGIHAMLLQYLTNMHLVDSSVTTSELPPRFHIPQLLTTYRLFWPTKPCLICSPAARNFPSQIVPCWLNLTKPSLFQHGRFRSVQIVLSRSCYEPYFDDSWPIPLSDLSMGWSDHTRSAQEHMADMHGYDCSLYVM